MMTDQTATPTTDGLQKPNEHIYEFLHYYTDFAEPPRYGVLIDGPWGVGKTHLINRFLDEKFAGRSEDFVYISLFGLRSTKDIDDALYARAHPFISSKKARMAGRVVKTFLKHKGIELEEEFNVRDFLANKEFALYVFDDLERSNMSTNEILGYINEFVEHDGCKVVLLANEKEIESSTQYRIRREKVVGKTFRVHSALHEALQQFISRSVDDRLKNLFENQESEIANLYNNSKIDNLRVLQQTIWDFGRLYDAFSEEHRNSPAAMTALLRLFFPLSFEYKTGHLNADQLITRPNGLIAAMHYESNSENGRLWKDIRDRYAGIDVLDSLPSNEIVESILAKGRVPAEEIRDCLDRSPYFASKKAEPSWQTAWYFYERTDDQFTSALADMEDKFARHEYTLPGEILHVFGLRLWLASEGMIAYAREQVQQQCASYVDRLKADGKLSPASNRFEMEDLFTGYAGLMYHQHESKDFRALAKYLQDKRKIVLEESFPKQAQYLLALLREDCEEFASRICNPQAEEGKNFYSIPILAGMNPAAFVDALNGLVPHEQRHILRSLSARYVHRNIAHDLPEEMAWLRSVTQLMKEPTNQLTFSQKRRDKFVEWYLDPVLKGFPADEDEEDKSETS